MKRYPLKIYAGRCKSLSGIFTGEVPPEIRVDVQQKVREMMPHFHLPPHMPTVVFNVLISDDDYLTAFVNFDGEQGGIPVFDSQHEVLG